MKTRKSKTVPKKVLSVWKKALTPYGTKAELSRHTEISKQTIRNILEAGAGLEDNVNKIYAYFEKQTA